MKSFFIRQFVCMDWMRHLYRFTGRKPRHDWLTRPGTEAPIHLCRRCELRLGF